ncbi:shikimate dehydrogenase [Parasphingorhabdus litoris]|uniref:Shikimate dehydrogenase (NADP(+)) n=1 Tax=Parasphingorhabdus litoris TaxID=394733 RepID=A0ABN1AH20_9SPHN|nr:shikimate dehydrogenase [Parasphingorhabdus litoris]
MTYQRPYAEVIGDPIAHSKSPIIHNFWLEKLGIKADYRMFHVKPDELADYIANRRDDPNWLGCNVTIPHKLPVMDHVSDPGEVRASIGAMNTIARTENGDLFGTNTDAGGFFAPIADLPLAGQDVIVIGAGGAAQAVLFALSRVDVGSVTIINRNVLKASALLARFGLKGQALEHGSTLPPARLLVNASALGMKGQDELIIDLDGQPDDAIIYDLVYVPLRTKLLISAQSRGLETIDGMAMLIGQAALAFEIFFGQAPPLEHDDELRRLLAT